MSLSPTDFAHIVSVLDSVGPSVDGVAALKARFVGLSFTRCHPSEVDTETPFFERETFSLYLVDAADHCWRLTDDPQRATGLVVAARGA